jgi:tetratricopeptide (TPR) repeat protein
MAGSAVHAWALAKLGLGYAGHRRDVAWARLVSYDHERRSAEHQEHPGIPIDTPERRESARILRSARLDPFGLAPMEAVFDSRQEVYSSANLIVLTVYGGEYVRCLPLFWAEAEAARSRGQLARAARCLAMFSGAAQALGRLDEARSAMTEADAIAARVGQPMAIVLLNRELLVGVLDEGWDELARFFEPLAVSTNPAISWALGTLRGGAARIAAHRGDAEKSLRFLDLLVPWLERAPAWTINFPMAAYDAAEALWLLDTAHPLSTVERAVREKIIGPDFRHPGVDGRLALARLCALTGRYDEAGDWFGEARRVLTEQGARPLLAIADYDEALMYARRGGPGDADRARPLLDAAHRQFEAVGMSGWIRRAEELIKRPG